jgi:hypothetical protein
MNIVQVNKLQTELDTAGAASSALLLKLDGLERENKRLRNEVCTLLLLLLLLLRLPLPLLLLLLHDCTL